MAAGRNDERCWKSVTTEAAAFKTISWLDRVCKSVMSASGGGGKEGRGVIRGFAARQKQQGGF